MWRRLDVDVKVVFAGDGSRLIVADVSVKSFEFRVAAVLRAPYCCRDGFFFGRLAPLLNDPKLLVLVGDRNAIFHCDIDKVGRGASRGGRCESSLIDLMAWRDLVDRFRLDHPWRVMWTWLDSSPSAKVGSYYDRVLEDLILISFVLPRSTCLGWRTLNLWRWVCS